MSAARVTLLWAVPVWLFVFVTKVNAQAADCSPHSYPQRTNQSLAVDPYDDRIVDVGVEGEGYFKTINE